MSGLPRGGPRQIEKSGELFRQSAPMPFLFRGFAARKSPPRGPRALLGKTLRDIAAMRGGQKPSRAPPPESARFPLYPF